MIRVLANWAAKRYYIFNQEFQAKTADLHAGLSLKTAGEKRELVGKLNKEADDIEANIKAMDEKLAAGYWECENAHERKVYCSCAGNSGLAIVHVVDCPLQGVTTKNGRPVGEPNTIQCSECGKPMKYVSTATMTGQEKYESDKERKEAQTILENKRAQAKAEEENAAGSEQAAKYFQGQAKGFRATADKIRSL